MLSSLYAKCFLFFPLSVYANDLVFRYEIESPGKFDKIISTLMSNPHQVIHRDLFIFVLWFDAAARGIFIYATKGSLKSISYEMFEYPIRWQSLNHRTTRVFMLG